MKLTAPIIIFTEIFSFLITSTNTNLIMKVVQAISQAHHFGYYIIMSSEEKYDKLLRENSLKILHSRLQFLTLVNVPIDENDKYIRRIKAASKWKRSNIEIKCLKIFNGSTEMSRKKFSNLSKEINFGDRHVWLLFLDKTISLEKYLDSILLPFNAQLILAIIQNSTHIYFKAPYRVADNLPLRIPDVGNWTEAEGLNLPVVDVAITRKNFEGFQLRAGTWHYPPVTIINYDVNGKFHITGYLADIWKELSERLNFTFVYHLSKDKAAGSESHNGTWNGLIGMLIRNEIDAAVIQLSLTKNRIKFVDFTAPIITTGNKIFYLNKGNQFEWGNFLRPFQIEVWLVIFLSFILITISLTFFHAIGCSYNTENYLLKQEYTILGSFLIVSRAFTNQGSDLTPESSPSRIVFFSAYLTMAVILPSYSAALISYLTIQTPYKPFDSFETMLKAKTHKLLVSLDTADYDYFSESKTPLIREVFKKLIKPLELSNRLPGHPKAGIEMVCKNNDLAFYGNYLSGTLFAEQNFLKHGCRIISMENFISSVDECLGFKKGSPYALAINLEVQKMIDTGSLRRFEKQVYLRKKENDASGYEDITIRHVIQIHCLLLGGYFISVTIFLMEIFRTRRKKYGVNQKT